MTFSLPGVFTSAGFRTKPQRTCLEAFGYTVERLQRHAREVWEARTNFQPFPASPTSEGDWIGLVGKDEPVMNCCTQAHISEKGAYDCAKNTAYILNHPERRQTR